MAGTVFVSCRIKQVLALSLQAWHCLEQGSLRMCLICGHPGLPSQMRKVMASICNVPHRVVCQVLGLTWLVPFG